MSGPGPGPLPSTTAEPRKTRHEIVVGDRRRPDIRLGHGQDRGTESERPHRRWTPINIITRRAPMRSPRRLTRRGREEARKGVGAPVIPILRHPFVAPDAATRPSDDDGQGAGPPRDPDARRPATTLPPREHAPPVFQREEQDRSSPIRSRYARVHANWIVCTDSLPQVWFITAKKTLAALRRAP